jgi:tRNA(fMet)-specific endonuclease VapC
MKKILLDTNAYVHFLSGNQDVFDALAKAETVYLSVVVIGELIAGFRGGNRELENRKTLADFCQKPTVVKKDINEETAEIFGELKFIIKQAGTPLPINDVWLAAQAMETGSVVVTYDHHFLKIPGLRVSLRK